MGKKTESKASAGISPIAAAFASSSKEVAKAQAKGKAKEKSHAAKTKAKACTPSKTQAASPSERSVATPALKTESKAKSGSLSYATVLPQKRKLMTASLKDAREMDHPDASQANLSLEELATTSEQQVQADVIHSCLEKHGQTTSTSPYPSGVQDAKAEQLGQEQEDKSLPVTVPTPEERMAAPDAAGTAPAAMVNKVDLPEQDSETVPTLDEMMDRKSAAAGAAEGVGGADTSAPEKMVDPQQQDALPGTVPILEEKMAAASVAGDDGGAGDVGKSAVSADVAGEDTPAEVDLQQQDALPETVPNLEEKMAAASVAGDDGGAGDVGKSAVSADASVAGEDTPAEVDPQQQDALPETVPILEEKMELERDDRKSADLADGKPVPEQQLDVAGEVAGTEAPAPKKEVDAKKTKPTQAEILDYRNLVQRRLSRLTPAEQSVNFGWAEKHDALPDFNKERAGQSPPLPPVLFKPGNDVSPEVFADFIDFKMWLWLHDYEDEKLDLNLDGESCNSSLSTDSEIRDIQHAFAEELENGGRGFAMAIFVIDQVKLVRDSIGDETLRFRCLPKKLNLLSACSGTGLFELCARALMKEINPEACVLSVQIFHAVKPS
eukprot:symbB.v1.2.020366.t1/scaffold1710.1/size105072/13